MDDLLGHSITYRVAIGQKVFALQTVPASGEDERREGVAQYAGFSLHAGTALEGEERGKLERLARYVTRPAVAEERLTLTAQGHVRYRLKTPYRDGTTQVVLEPLDFLARLAALVPPPRVHLTRYHGVFAPHAALRAAITPAGRGRVVRRREGAEEAPPRLAHVPMSWTQRLKRVFAIEIERCQGCGGRLEVIASIEEPALIERILGHLRQRARADQGPLPLGARAPPPPPLP
jgi:Putative transposase